MEHQSSATWFCQFDLSRLESLHFCDVFKLGQLHRRFLFLAPYISHIDLVNINIFVSSVLIQYKFYKHFSYVSFLILKFLFFKMCFLCFSIKKIMIFKPSEHGRNVQLLKIGDHGPLSHKIRGQFTQVPISSNIYSKKNVYKSNDSSRLTHLDQN